MAAPFWKSLFRGVTRAAKDAVRVAVKDATRPPRTRRPAKKPKVRTSPDYPGDFAGRPHITYAPFPDDRADPGEVVWTWVPFEEDHRQGKDRPVIIIGHDGPWLLAVQMSSKDHDHNVGYEASQGRYWLDIGTGAWDEQRRPSEVRLDRIIRVDPAKVRRISVKIDRVTFDQIAAGIHRFHDR